jgi:NADPH-dependent curcumin reductase CurA
VNEGVRIAEPSAKTKIDEIDKVIRGAPPDKNIVGFDIAVNNVSRVNKFQKGKLVLEFRKYIYNNKTQ